MRPAFVNIGERLDLIRKQKERKARAQAMKATQVQQAKRGFTLTRVDQLVTKKPEFLIDGLVEARSLGMIFGDPACGKSFLAIDFAACVATGHRWHGRKVKRGSVIYLAGEGHSGIGRRLAAWSKANAVPLDGVSLYLSNSAAQFLDKSMMQEVTKAIEETAASSGSPALIVVDTVARSFGAGDENSTKDMNGFVAALDQVRHRYGCTILLVHHTGHTDKRRARGNIALKGALDAEYKLEKHGDGITLECTKMKDATEPEPLQFVLTSVDLGPDDDGHQITSAVLSPAAGVFGRRAQKLTSGQILAIQSYEAAALAEARIDEHGKFLGVHLDAWREKFYAAHTGDSVATKRKAFSRARSDMVETGRYRVDNDFYFPAGANAAEEEVRIITAIRKQRDTGQ